MKDIPFLLGRSIEMLFVTIPHNSKVKKTNKQTKQVLECKIVIFLVTN